MKLWVVHKKQISSHKVLVHGSSIPLLYMHCCPQCSALLHQQKHARKKAVGHAGAPLAGAAVALGLGAVSLLFLAYLNISLKKISKQHNTRRTNTQLNHVCCSCAALHVRRQEACCTAYLSSIECSASRISSSTTSTFISKSSSTSITSHCGQSYTSSWRSSSSRSA
jgi:hypothetical protein